MSGGFNPGLGLAILRVPLGMIFLAHGWPKLFGGIELTTSVVMSVEVPLPMLFAWTLALLETLGGILLVVGYLVKPAALLLIPHILTGIFLVHLPNGFYVIGPGREGIEFSLMLMAGLFALLFVGAGSGTLQGRFQKNIKVREPLTSTSTSSKPSHS